MALDFPKHMKEKNTQAVSKSLDFSYLSEFHSAFSSFNPWGGRSGGGRSCAENIGRNRGWRQILPLPIPMKIVDKVYFQESYVVHLLERIHYSYPTSLVVCAVGHRRGLFLGLSEEGLLLLRHFAIWLSLLHPLSCLFHSEVLLFLSSWCNFMK